MLRFGPATGPVVVAAPALFEEANRTRAFLVTVLRRLAEQGIGSVLPDLPGQGESTRPTIAARLEDWRTAFAACVETVGSEALVFAMRGGTLVASSARNVRRYYLEPEPGAELVRLLLRARRAALLASGGPVVADDPLANGPPLLLGGNLLARELVQDLMLAVPDTADRTVEVFPSPFSSHVLLKGRRLWLASEPSVDDELADSLTRDLSAWVRTCAA